MHHVQSLTLKFLCPSPAERIFGGKFHNKSLINKLQPKVWVNNFINIYKNKYKIKKSQHQKSTRRISSNQKEVQKTYHLICLVTLGLTEKFSQKSALKLIIVVRLNV